MTTCRICKHKELSNQEMLVYRAMVNLNNAPAISKHLGISRKCALQVLYKLESGRFVSRIGRKKFIIYKPLKLCLSCDKFKFMSAFNTWSCNKSKGINWYCNDYHKEATKCE